MRITLAELEIHRVIASESYPQGSLDFRDAEFRQATPVRIDATAELLAQEIRIRGRLQTRLESCCDRCLGAVEIPIDNTFDLFYRPMQTIAEEEEIEIPEDELGIGFYSGDGIELEEVATEQVLLAMPMKVVCSEECRGLCPVCGANRNMKLCGCAPPHEDSPFASLKEE